MSVTMKVLIAACGNHDARVLSGEGVRRPENGDKGEIQWRGGEVIVVTEDLAAKYEASGQAERVSEKRETATVSAKETREKEIVTTVANSVARQSRGRR